MVEMPLKNDLESYKQPWESSEHWSLRKEFLLTHQERFDDENRLLCLAQVYANVELLGCSYPAEVMVKISELAKDLKNSDQVRESKKKKSEILFTKETKSAPLTSDRGRGGYRGRGGGYNRGGYSGDYNRGNYGGNYQQGNYSGGHKRPYQDTRDDGGNKRQRASNYF